MTTCHDLALLNSGALASQTSTTPTQHEEERRLADPSVDGLDEPLEPRAGVVALTGLLGIAALHARTVPIRLTLSTRARQRRTASVSVVAASRAP